MPVPPLPPTKPTPPLPPTMTPANSTSSTTANPAVTSGAGTASGAAKSNQAKPGAKTDSAAAADTSSSKPASPLLGSQETETAQTAVPAQLPLVNSKPAGFNYIPFVGIVGMVAIILFIVKLMKPQPKPARTVIDYSQNTTAAMNKEGIDVLVSTQTTAPKVKSNFELRV